MNKLDLARRLARKSHRSRGEAADDVDTLVYRMLKELKRINRPAAAREEHPSAVPAAAAKEKA